MTRRLDGCLYSHSHVGRILRRVKRPLDSRHLGCFEFPAWAQLLTGTDHQAKREEGRDGYPPTPSRNPEGRSV